MSEAIKEFWDNQAQEFGASDLATAPDHAFRELEIRSIVPHIKGKWIADVGCGNGYSTFKLQEAHPDKKFIGFDYSTKMINAAIAEAIHRHSDIMYVTGDVRSFSTLSIFNHKFDSIISERCIINLTSWEEQQTAILEMKKCLKPGGRLILVENFFDGLLKLNELRRQFGLHRIDVRWHNLYLYNDEFVDFSNQHFNCIHHENIGNLYYLFSRIGVAVLAKQEDKEPDYNHPLNYIAAKLPSLGTYGYSPNMLYVLTPK